MQETEQERAIRRQFDDVWGNIRSDNVRIWVNTVIGFAAFLLGVIAVCL